MIRRWGLLCTDCWVGVDLGRILGADRSTVSFELLEEPHTGHGVGLISTLLAGHAGHSLTIVDTDEVLRALEDLDPSELPIDWLRKPSGSLPTDSEVWKQRSGGRLVTKWLSRHGTRH